MKRSQMVVQMVRYYNLKQGMLENGAIPPMEFFSSILELVEQMGIMPPCGGTKSTYCSDCFDHVWEDE